MGKSENKVKEIIKAYEEEKSEINKKYEAKPQKKYDNEATKKKIEKIDKELKPLDNEIELLKRGLQNVREEEPRNKDVILQYEKQIKDLEQDKKRKKLLNDKQEILEESLLEKNKIDEENKNIDLENKKNNLENKDNKQKELRVAEDKVRKALTQESIVIENDIEKLELDMKMTLHKMRTFEYEYEEGTRICINGDEFKKISEKYNKQQDLKKDLNKARNLCYTKLNEFKEKDAKRVEKIKEALNKNQNRNIYSHSKDRVDSININAAEGKAHVSTIQGENKEIDIKEAIKNRKGMFKDLKINERIQSSNVKSKIQQFMIRRKINPVILEAIKDDGDEVINDYISSVIEGRKFKFDYEHNLENSTLSAKEHRFMNKIALTEDKIEGNTVKGAAKIHTIKNLFTKAKSKAKMIGKKEVLALDEGEKIKQPKENKFKKNIKDMAQSKDDIIEKRIKEREEKIQDAYENLSETQKEDIQKYFTKNDNDIYALQRLGLDYSIAYGMIEKYGNKTSKDKDEQANGAEQGE